MKIKNKDLIAVINFLDGLKVKGLKSIHRTNLTEKLKSKVEKFDVVKDKLQEDYKDDTKKMNEEFKAFMEQENNINESDNKVEIESLKSIIKPLIAEDSETEFSGADAVGLAVVYNALKLDEKGDKKNENN